jgi:hypothetical protein
MLQRLHRLALGFACGLALAAMPAMAQNAVTPPGTGTAADPYRITELGHLVWMGDTTATSAGKHYALLNDIDAAATATWNEAGTDGAVTEGFAPIGTPAVPFGGEFDGQGHVVRGLTIDRVEERGVGLFGWISSGGGVRRLGLEGGSVSGQWHVGGVVGFNGGTLEHCYARVAVAGSFCVGGLVGYHYRGAIRQGYAAGAVTGGSEVGGLLGLNDCGTVEECYWDVEASGWMAPPDGLGRTTAELRQQATYAGWNFTDIWGIAADRNAGYPYLLGRPAPAVPAGAGTVADPYRIAGVAHLLWLGDTVAASAGKSYVLLNDIAAAATAGWNDAGTDVTVLEGFAPIGTTAQPFCGWFDGQGHVVRGLTVNRAEADGVGLFGGIGSGGVIRGLGLEGGAIAGGWHVGGLAGWNAGTVEQCYATAAVAATGYHVGGLVGGSTGTLDQCYAAGTVSGDSHVGGLVGFTSGSVARCYATGVVAGQDDAVGGLAGYSSGALSQCDATGTVTGQEGDGTGGLVGNSSGTVTQCNAAGAVTGASSVGGLVGRNYWGAVEGCQATGVVAGANHVGGLVGHNECRTVRQCSATGAVTGHTDVGGLVGFSSGTLTQSYATGPVAGGSRTGGLLGGNQADALEGWAPGEVEQCYATGAVTGMAEVGGLLGYNEGGSLARCYWDTETSGWTTSAAGEGRTTAQMRQRSTFAEWDFGAAWGLVAGDSYPFLLWAPPPFALTVTASGPGSVSVDLVQASYAAGTVVALHATAGADAEFERWLGPVASPTAARTTVTMAGHLTVVGVFRTVRGIASILELQRIGRDPDYSANGHYWLTQDVDAGETAAWNDAGTDDNVLEGFRPVGSEALPFTGDFDGQDHVIRALRIERPRANGVGLFGWVGRAGVVRRLGLEGGSVVGRWYVGGIAGGSSGTLTQCHTTGAVADGAVLGGLVGWNERGSIRQCYTTGAVTGSPYLGGLVGWNRGGTVEQCYATGKATGGRYVGGLLGWNDGGMVAQCYARGAVHGYQSVGGLVGSNSGPVTQCYWDTGTSLQFASAGGAGRTTVQMRQQATYSGWGFADTWGIVADRNGGYPYLRGVGPWPVRAVTGREGTAAREVSQAGPGSREGRRPPRAARTGAAAAARVRPAAPARPAGAAPGAKAGGPD